MSEEACASESGSSQEKTKSTNELPEAPVPPELFHLARETFSKTALYLQGQLEGTADEYKLIEDMNRATAQRWEYLLL